MEYTFKDWEQLYSGNQEFDYQSTDWNDDRYLPLLMKIESAITAVYRTNPAVEDKQVIAVLERLATKPEMNFPAGGVRDTEAGIEVGKAAPQAGRFKRMPGFCQRLYLIPEGLRPMPF
jgi:hypothetical protein